MQGRNFFILLLFAFFILSGSEANAQKLTTNKDGESIIVYPDGSWRYFDEDDPEDIEEVEAAKSEEEKVEEKKKKPKKSKKKKTKKKKSKKTKKKKTKTKKSKGKKSSKKNRKKSKASINPAAEKAAKSEAIRRADLAAGKEETARLTVEDKVFKRIFLEEELVEAYQNVDMTHEDVAVIEADLKEAKAEEKASKNELKKAADLAKTLEKMIDMPKAKRDKLLAKIDGTSKKKHKKNKADEATDRYSNSDESPKMPSWGRRKLVAYNPKNDVMLNPPSVDCNLTFDGVDEFSGNRRKDVTKQLFFTYTPERFKPYFKGRNYITCHGFLSKVSDVGTMLNLEFVILTEQAVREFGVLEMGSDLIIRGIDGDRITLTNKKTSTGIANSLDKTTTYKARYLINSSDIKKLSKTEVDKLRVIWGTGYEDYEVYEVDFLIDQFKCLR